MDDALMGCLLCPMNMWLILFSGYILNYIREKFTGSDEGEQTK